MNDLQFLSRLFPPDRLAVLLPAYGEWRPYPTAADRAGWEALPEAMRENYLALGKKALGTDWPPLPASLYLDFALNGNRSRYEAPYFTRRSLLAALTLAECIEGQGRFLRRIMDCAWSMCEESSWCLPAHTGVQKAGPGLPDPAEPVVDLFAAETAAQLAWAHYLLGDRLAQPSPRIPERIEHEVQLRVLTPALEREDWGWMGFKTLPVNNWNPWINSNWLACALLVEKDPARRVQAVAKILRSLDRFLVPYPSDGGCDEGPGYWTRAGASLYDCLELLYSASSGKIDVYSDPKVGEIGRFVYRAHIDQDYYINFADASALNAPEAALVFGYGKRIQDPQMASLGAWLASRQRGAEGRLYGDLFRNLQALFSQQAMQSVEPRPPLRRDAWLSEIQVMAARDQAGSSQGWYLAAKGGHNAESHNHNDIGNFIVYRDGKPVIIDVGVETYTRKTFSARRYEIWTMQSAYHSLPTIDGVMQAAGREFAARDVSYESNDEAAQFTLDIASAYPPEARVKTWLRTLTLRRGESVTLKDSYELLSPASELHLSLMTPCAVETDPSGVVWLGEAPLPDGRLSGVARIQYDPTLLSVTVEAIPVADASLGPVWGGRLTRLLFNAVEPGERGEWTIKFGG